MFLDPASWVAAGTAAAPWLAKGIAAALKKDKVVFVRILASGAGGYEDNVTALGDRFVALVFYNISPHAMYLEDLEISVPKNRPLTVVELDPNKLPINPARVRTYEPNRVLPITLVPGDSGRVIFWPNVTNVDAKLEAITTFIKERPVVPERDARLETG